MLVLKASGQMSRSQQAYVCGGECIHFDAVTSKSIFWFSLDFLTQAISAGMRVKEPPMYIPDLHDDDERVYTQVTLAISVGKEDADDSESCTKIHRPPRIIFPQWDEATIVGCRRGGIVVSVDCIWRQIWTSNIWIRVNMCTARERWSVECHVDVQTSEHCINCNNTLSRRHTNITKIRTRYTWELDELTMNNLIHISYRIWNELLSLQLRAKRLSWLKHMS